VSTARATKVAIVTGGGTGTGAATSRLLAAHGYAVLVNYNRSAEAAEATVASCREHGADATAARGDVADDADCRRLVAEAVERFGRLDAVVNSAGTTQFTGMGDLDAQNAADFHAIYAVNLIGPFQMARAAAPHLRQAGAGAIVNVSSTSTLTGDGSSFAYVASKAALNALTLGLARQLAPEIRVNAVMPGLIDSDWFPRAMGQEAYERVRANWVARSPLGKISTPEQVAETIVWLVDHAAMITGQIVTVDGGALLGPKRG